MSCQDTSCTIWSFLNSFSKQIILRGLIRCTSLWSLSCQDTSCRIWSFSNSLIKQINKFITINILRSSFFFYIIKSTLILKLSEHKLYDLIVLKSLIKQINKFITVKWIKEIYLCWFGSQGHFWLSLRWCGTHIP